MALVEEGLSSAHCFFLVQIMKKNVHVFFKTFRIFWLNVDNMAALFPVSWSNGHIASVILCMPSRDRGVSRAKSNSRKGGNSVYTCRRVKYLLASE